MAGTRAAGIREPGEMRFFVDDIEALVALGQFDDADSTLAFFQECAVSTGRASALAAAARCRGTIAEANGDLEPALKALHDSAFGYATCRSRSSAPERCLPSARRDCVRSKRELPGNPSRRRTQTSTSSGRRSGPRGRGRNWLESAAGRRRAAR